MGGQQGAPIGVGAREDKRSEAVHLLYKSGSASYNHR